MDDLSTTSSRHFRDRLAAMLPTPSAGLKGPGPGLFTYCAFAHERLADVRLPQPAAERLAMAGSTLRRRLATEGTSFREILRAVRLDAADRILAARGSSAEAAAAVGLSSRGHFARAYRDRFGLGPSERKRMQSGNDVQTIRAD